MRNALLLLAVMLTTSCSEPDPRAGGPAGRGPGAGQAIGVTTARVKPQPFVDKIEAVGTAFAKESVVLSANVTERIESLNFQDGTKVRRGQVLARLSSSEENADLREAEARLREAELQLDRLRTLEKGGFTTQSQLESQVAARDSARAAVQTIQARLADRVIRAPFDGYVGLRRVSAGLIVNAGTPIVEINDIDVINLDFNVPEVFFASLAVGQQIEAAAAAFDGRTFTGSISSIDPQIDAITRSVGVRAALPNPEGVLKPGMLLTIVLQSTPRTSLTIPEAALVPRLDQQFVFVVSPESLIVERRPVRIGVRRPGYVEVLEGVSEGELVVVEGTLNVREGAVVRLAGANGAGAPAGSGASPVSGARP